MARALMPSLSRRRDIKRALATSLLVTLVASATAQAPSVQFSRLVYPPDSYEDIAGEKVLCFRAVDVMTGTPLAQAELFLIAESNNPVRGEFTFQQRLTADADGFVRVPLGQDLKRRSWSWMLLRAPGFGQRMEMGAFEEVELLPPTIDLPVQVLDSLGAPVAGCLVGFCCGCGHTPDIVSAFTDRNGACTLPGINNRQGIRDLYLEHKRLGLFYDSLDWFPGEPAAVIRAPSANAAQGVVVDENGKPVAGAFVGYKDVHRGPWTRTGADGSFLLCGISQGPSDLWVHVGERELLFELDDTVPLRLQLPPAPPPPDEPARRTEVVELPADVRRRVEARSEPGPWPALESPTVPVRLIGATEDTTVELTSATRSLDVTDLVQRGEPVPLPDEPFAFVLQQDWQPRTFPFTRATALAEGIVRLRWFQPTRIEGRIVGEAGHPLAARLALLDPTATMAPKLDDLDDLVSSAGAIQLTAKRQGLALLAVMPTDTDHAPRIVPVLLPPRGDEVVVDVGTITLTERPQYLLHDAKGELLVDWQVGLLRRGFVTTENFTSYPESHHVRLTQEGHAPLPDLQPGDVLHVLPTTSQPEYVDSRAIYTVPARFVVRGAGPWDFSLPSGQLWVNVRCDDEPQARMHVYLDDLDLELFEPTLLRGLPPGRHRCLVSAKGHQTAIVDLDVPAAGIAELDLVLPPR